MSSIFFKIRAISGGRKKVRVISEATKIRECGQILGGDELAVSAAEHTLIFTLLGFIPQHLHIHDI